MPNSNLKSLFSRGLYIHAPDQTLTHFSGCLVEGLLDLGIGVKTNATQVTSRPASTPLTDFDLSTIHAEPLTGFSAYLVDISATNTFVRFEGVEPAPVAYITTSDISIFSEVPDPHIVFVAHDSTAAVKPGRRIPIAFGLPQHLCDTSKDSLTPNKRDQVALDSFRPTLHQGVRALLDLAFTPALAQNIPVTKLNVPPTRYIKALENSALCLAYGGEFYSPIMGNHWFKNHQPALFAQHTFDHVDTAAVLRWDSWRFWEALACGCIPIHLDFEKYKFNLPVIPEAWTHYIPIDLSDLSESADAIWKRRAQWPDIAAAGRAWAIEHYAPAPTARRILTALADVLP
ncbi:MAG: hypothetical protein RIB43_05140 [Rhodospirillaceae bacterium]